MLGSKDCIPKELAYIEIFLKNLPNKSIYNKVIKEKKSSGKVLMKYKIRTKRKIKRFFKLHKDSQISKYSKNNAKFFYGKQYSIFLSSSKRLLANVIEILL